MRIKSLIVLGGLTSLISAGLFSCTDETIERTIVRVDTVCNDSAAPEWLLYYHYVEETDQQAVFTPVYSTKTYTAVDTLVYPMFIECRDLKFTSDGKYMVWAGGGLSDAVWCADYKTLDTVGIVKWGYGFKYLALSSGDEYVAAYEPGDEKLGVYTVPGMFPVWEDTSSRKFTSVFLAGPERLLFTSIDDDTAVFIADFLGNPGTIDTIIIKARDSTNLHNLYFGADFEHNILYASGAVPSLGGAEFLAIDMATMQVSKRIVMNGNHWVTVSRSGELVFLNETCAYRDVLIYRRNGGTLETFLDFSDVISPSFRPKIVAVTPDDSLVGIVTMPDCDPFQGTLEGHLLVVEVKSRVIQHVFYHNAGPGRSYALAVYPISR